MVNIFFQHYSLKRIQEEESGEPTNEEKIANLIDCVEQMMEKLHQFENKMEKLTDKIEQLLLSKEVHIVKLASRSAFFKVIF